MIKGVGVNAVLWDLGGVLCRFAPDRRLRAIAHRSGRSTDEVVGVVDQALLQALDHGDLGGPALHRLVRERLDWDCSYEELARAWAAAFRPDEEVLALARRVTVPAGVLSDNGPPTSDRFRDVLPDVAALVAVTVFSADIGRTKPCPEAFDVACRRLGTPPSQTLFVDDNPANVVGARDAGLQAVAFTTIQALQTTLDHAGILR